jgi:putative chitinase
MVNSEQLAKLHIGPEWVDALNVTFQKFNIQTVRQQAAFIGQCGHECGNFTVLSENLNYKAEALMRLWSSRFPTIEIANQYAKNPQKIANKVYANRMGNRDESSGDGYRFRGRGCIQTTGHANYYHAGQSLGVDLVMQPDLVASPQYAALTAGFFWSTHSLNDLAEQGNNLMLTKRINGGTNGLDDRINRTNQALSVLS